MATFLNLYNDIEYKIKQAIVRLNEVSSVLKERNAEKEQLEEEINELRKQVEDLQERNKLLTITKTVLSKEDRKETIKKINDYVREIDVCIGVISSNDE